MNKGHVAFTPADFRNPTFLRIRRQIARLRLQTADDPRLIALLKQTITVYNDLLGD